MQTYHFKCTFDISLSSSSQALPLISNLPPNLTKFTTPSVSSILFHFHGLHEEKKKEHLSIYHKLHPTYFVLFHSFSLVQLLSWLGLFTRLGDWCSHRFKALSKVTQLVIFWNRMGYKYPRASSSTALLYCCGTWNATPSPAMRGSPCYHIRQKDPILLLSDFLNLVTFSSFCHQPSPPKVLR